MTFFIVEAQSTFHKLRMFLEVDNLEEIKKSNKFCMVMIPRPCTLILIMYRTKLWLIKKIPSMDSLITQLLNLTTRNLHDFIKSFVMVSTLKRGGRGNWGDKVVVVILNGLTVRG